MGFVAFLNAIIWLFNLIVQVQKFKEAKLPVIPSSFRLGTFEADDPNANHIQNEIEEQTFTNDQTNEQLSISKCKLLKQEKILVKRALKKETEKFPEYESLINA